MSTAFALCNVLQHTAYSSEHSKTTASGCDFEAQPSRKCPELRGPVDRFAPPNTRQEHHNLNRLCTLPAQSPGFLDQPYELSAFRFDRFFGSTFGRQFVDQKPGQRSL